MTLIYFKYVVAAVVGRVISEVDDKGVHIVANNVIIAFTGLYVTFHVAAHGFPPVNADLSGFLECVRNVENNFFCFGR